MPGPRIPRSTLIAMRSGRGRGSHQLCAMNCTPSFLSSLRCSPHCDSIPATKSATAPLHNLNPQPTLHTPSTTPPTAHHPQHPSAQSSCRVGGCQEMTKTVASQPFGGVDGNEGRALHARRYLWKNPYARNSRRLGFPMLHVGAPRNHLESQSLMSTSGLHPHTLSSQLSGLRSQF